MSVKKSMSIRLPEGLVDDLKAKASEEGVSVTEMINRFTRMGLKFTADDRLPLYVGTLEHNGTVAPGVARPVQEPSNGYLSSQLLYQPPLDEEMASPSSKSDKHERLLEGFEKFIAILDHSMSYLADDRNRESVLETIGELAKLKTRLKFDPCFKD